MKRWEDKGAFLEAPGPVKLRRYRPGRLPNAAECVDCLIVINDDADGDPRPRVAISNGASWDYLARGDQLVSAPPSTSLVVQPSRPSEIDITPMVRAAVEAALPAMIPQPVKVIEQIRHEPVAIGGEAAQLREHIKALATANLEISEHLNTVLVQCADLMERVEYLERHALAKAEIKAA